MGCPHSTTRSPPVGLQQENLVNVCANRLKAIHLETQESKCWEHVCRFNPQLCFTLANGVRPTDEQPLSLQGGPLCSPSRPWVVGTLLAPPEGREAGREEQVRPAQPGRRPGALRLWSQHPPRSRCPHPVRRAPGQRWVLRGTRAGGPGNTRIAQLHTIHNRAMSHASPTGELSHKASEL